MRLRGKKSEKSYSLLKKMQVILLRLLALNNLFLLSLKELKK